MNMHRITLRRTAVAVSAVAAALALAGCGSETASHEGHGGKSSAAESKQKGGAGKADVAFAAGMIPHHRQAVEMAELAESRAGSDEVRKLAEEIEKAQGPEIETMSGWLRSWGEKVPPEDAGHSAGGHGDGHAMPGMMTGKQMADLKKASGKDFDGQFLAMMVDHHDGAVEMARTEREDGTYGPAKKLAGRIITAQQSEIAQMKKLLGKD